MLNTNINLKFITEALLELRPNATFHIANLNNGYDILDYSSESTIPSNAEIIAKATELENAFNNQQYQRDRADAYPSIQQQLDMQYWDSVNGTTTWQDAINAVKAQYPKP